jgi:hypothetical protein
MGVPFGGGYMLSTSHAAAAAAPRDSAGTPREGGATPRGGTREKPLAMLARYVCWEPSPPSLFCLPLLPPSSASLFCLPLLPPSSASRPPPLDLVPPPARIHRRGTAREIRQVSLKASR